MSSRDPLPPEWAGDFERAVAAWPRVGHDDPVNAEAGTENWAADFDRMVRTQRALLSQGAWLAGPNDLLGIVQLHRWERAHSAALGWLLDPVGAHGLGAAMLRSFLQATHLSGSEVQEPVEVVLEANGGSAFADVLVRSRNWTLVVEVKIDAVEQKEQAMRLWSDWRDEVSPTFVYLTPSGRGTTTHVTEECREAWIPMRWRDVAKHLNAALASPEAVTARGTDAARQYAMTLQSLFGKA